eukprot:scaffold199568_cov19-Tisochrysis_lutea.AAC.1
MLECKNKGAQHASRLGFLIGHIYHIQVHAPARIESQLSWRGHVTRSTLCFSACTCFPKSSCKNLRTEKDVP